MKRLHLHVSVPDLAHSIQFYETLFGAPPTVVKDDYAKWMLEDPRVNFAISARGGSAGVNHVGVQVESAEELTELAGRLKAAGERMFDQANTSCCYAKSDKSWVTDPAGVRWETFYTFGESISYGEDVDHAEVAREPTRTACCGASPASEAKVSASACC